MRDPSMAVLRASDLPRGYQEGDDTSCGTALTTEGNDAKLDSLFLKERPKACVVELERVWAIPKGPPSITSAAYVFRSADGARRGFRARGDLAEYTASLSPRQMRNAELGDEAALLSGRGLNDPATAIVWRSGNVVGVLAVEPADERAARELADRQEKRIEGKAEPGRTIDTVELQLDDPTLHLPVYWLGRVFDPGEGLPRLTLEEAVVLGTGPGNAVKLDYGGAVGNRFTALTLDLWEPASWRRFRRTLVGRLVWDSDCARKTIVRLPNGHAEIFEGYGTPRPLEPPCPTRPPDRVLAHVYIDGVVVAVNMPYCYACAAGSPTKNPYETVPRMTAIARGLSCVGGEASAAPDEGAELVRERGQLLRLERVDDVVALAPALQEPGSRQEAQLLRCSGLREVDERGQFLRAPRLLREQLQDPQPSRVGERLQEPDELRRRCPAQVVDEVRRAVEDGQRPRRVAVDPHVGPDVDARDEQQRIVGPDRDVMVVRDVETEAPPARIDAELRREGEQEGVDAVAGDLAAG